VKIVIVGAGPAGLMAAGAAKAHGAEIIVLEKNEKAGKKLYITGKGRCNITNSCESSTFFDNVIHNSKFLYSAINNFDYNDCINFFETNGLKTKTERGGRVFPVSDKASDVTKSLLAYVTHNAITQQRTTVDIKYNTQVKELIAEKNIIKGVRTNQGDILGDAVIIATGGKSYPGTGSTGDGYILAKSAGHTVVDIKPALVPITTDMKDIESLQGLALKNVEVTAVTKDGNFTEFGEMLFTDRGISGPIVLTLSSRINETETEYVSINLKPAISADTLDKRLLRDFSSNLNKQIRNSLDELLPKSLIPIIIGKSGIKPDTRVNQITAEQRSALIAAITDFRLYGVKPGSINEAIVTAGGVSTKEINPKTMESKLVKGLYFAGEVIDVDGLTGGYNIHIALATGKAAGTNAVNSEY